MWHSAAGTGVIAHCQTCYCSEIVQESLSFVLTWGRGKTVSVQAHLLLLPLRANSGYILSIYHTLSILLEMEFTSDIFKASALWADAFYKSKYCYVCVCVCVFVHHTFSLRLPVFLPPLPEVQCPNFLDIWNISNGKKWSPIWKLLLIKGVKLLQWKKVFFYGFFLIFHSV